MLFGRASRIAFDILGTLVVLMLIAGGMLGWRLSIGPLSLKFMTPLIERALSDESGGLTVRIDDTVLAWGGGLHNIDLRVRGVRAVGRDGHLMLELPEVATSFSARALLRGLIAPTTLDAIGAQIVLRHAADGSWQFHTTREDDDSASAIGPLLDDLLNPPDRTNRLGYLQSISVFRASLTLVDEVSGQTVVARDMSAALGRDAGGLRARLSAVAEINGTATTVSLTGRYDAAHSIFDGGLDFAKLDPVALSALAPALAPLSGLNVPLSGRLTATMNSDFDLVRGGFDINGQNGRLEAGPYKLPVPATVRRLHVRGKLPNGISTVELDDAEIDLNGPTVSLQGRAAGLDAHPRVSGVVMARNVPTDDLARLWPLGAGANARAWVTENLSRGMVGEARAEFAAAPAATDWAVERLGGSLRFTGIEVNYMPGMPHVLNVSGEAKFAKDRFDIATTSGELGGLRVTRGAIALTALDTNNEQADIHVEVSGPLREALELADREPLGYLKKIGLAPSDFTGEENLRLDLKFPLKKTIKVDELQVVAAAEVHRLTERQAALGQDVKDGDVTVRIARDGMDINGRVQLGPVPVDIVLRRNFSETATLIGRTQARGRIASDDLAKFGFDLRPYVQGPIGLAVDYVERRGARSDVTIDAKLDDAIMTIAELDWTKPAVPAGTARLVIDLVGGQVKTIRSVAVNVGDPAKGGLAAQGWVDFGADGKTITRVDFDTLKVGLTDAHGSWVRSPSGMSVDLAGRSFNVGPLMKGDSTKVPDRPPLDLKVAVERLYFAGDRWLDLFTMQGHRGPERWESADLMARAGDGARGRNDVVLTLQNIGGRQKFDMVAEDAGAFLRAVDVTPNVSGGRLNITGQTDEKRPGRPLAGHVHISEYRVTRAPVLARVLSVALLTGVVDALRGEGIRFAQFDADYVYDGSRFEILDARSAGPSLGITARGIIDSDADTIDLTGTLVPANALNSLPGKIPIIGNIFTGGGGGVFAATYKIAGPMSDPKTSVNPLSTLAPGFLRNLFRSLPGVSSSDSRPESEKELDREQPPRPTAPQ